MRRAIVVGLLSLLFAASARAQSDADLEVARTLWGEGRALEDKSDWEGALAKFRAVAAIKSTAIVRYHQGYCAEKTGHWVEALDAYARAQLEGKGDPAQKEAVDASKDAAAALRPRVPKLRVVLHGDGAAKAAVTIDDAPVSRAIIDADEPIPIDVGFHTVAIGGSGVVAQSTDVEVAEGETKEASFDAKSSAPTPGGVPTATTTSASATTIAPARSPAAHGLGLVFGVSFGTITPGGKLTDPSYSQLEYYRVRGSTDASEWMSTGFSTELLAGVRIVPAFAIYLSWQHGFLGDGGYGSTLESYSARTDAVAIGAMVDSNPRGLIGVYGDLSIAQRWTHTHESTSGGAIDGTLSGLEFLRAKVGVSYHPIRRWSFLAYVFLDVGSYTKMSYDGISTSLSRDVDKTSTHTFAGLGLAALYDLPLL